MPPQGMSPEWEYQRIESKTRRVVFYSGPLGPCLIIRHSKVSRTFYLGYLFMNHQKTLFSLGLGGYKDGPLKLKFHLADSEQPTASLCLHGFICQVRGIRDLLKMS